MRQKKKVNTNARLFDNSYLMEKHDFVHNVPNIVKHYLKNAIITLHDMNAVGFLLGGIAILTRITIDGDEQSPKFISTSHVIDYAYQDGSDDRYELTLCQDCEIVWFERGPFYDYINKHMQFYRELFLLEVQERRFVDRFNEATSNRLAIDKVYEILVWLSSVYRTKTFSIPTTMTKFGSIIGLSRDRLSESLTALVEEGKIKQEKTYRITILD